MEGTPIDKEFLGQNRATELLSRGLQATALVRGAESHRPAAFGGTWGLQPTHPTVSHGTN
jgi:hypothetical protein